LIAEPLPVMPQGARRCNVTVKIRNLLKGKRNGKKTNMDMQFGGVNLLESM
jgi:hypothetical protein